MIDHQVQTILDELARRSAGSAPLPMLAPAAIRHGDLEFSKLCCQGTIPEPVGRAADHTIGGPGGALKLRVYTPVATKPVGALMFFHGGGFMMGGLDSHDHICRVLCNYSAALVVAVDYRLAPENKYPAALDDCLSATRWVAANAAALQYPDGHLAVSGDSAGGALAALVATKSRDEDGPALRFQLLFYPETSASLDWPSVKEFWEPGRMAAGKGMGFFRGKYFASPDDAHHRYAYPDNTSDLAALPAAFIATAEIDPMRDMAEAYAKRLEAAGVPTTLRRYDGVTHVFISMFPRVDIARQALEMGARAAGAALK